MPFPYIFTFYSYKGGVGRSMALLNVAYTLVSRGRHVLILDLDLEAPGVSGFMHRNGELDKPIGAHPKDVLSLLYLAMETVRTGQKADHVPPVSNFLRSVRPDKLATLEPKFGKVGRLDVIGADQERNYLGRLAELQFKDLAQEQLIDLSRLLNVYFKQQRFPFRPLGVEESDPPISTPYDYILVDSRTGITEFGGLCVGPLCDRLVVLTGLNDQNVIGTRFFFDEVGIKPQARTADAIPWDDADPVATMASESPSLGPKPTIVVASPVPSGEVKAKRERMEELEKALGIRPLILSYHPQIALKESIFIRDFSEEYMTGEYAKLTSRLMEQVGDDPRQSFSKVMTFLQDGRLKTMEPALRVAAANPEIGWAVMTTLAERATNSIPEFDLRRLFTTMARNDSDRPAVLDGWGNALSNLAKIKSGSEADRLLAEAYQKYSESSQLKPDDPNCLNNWGVALARQAKTKSGPEAGRLLAEACQKYSESSRLRPDDPNYLNNWGNALSNLAKTKTGPEANRLFAEACQKYGESLRLKPDDPNYLNNWGITLADQAKTKLGPEADRLFAEASQKYSESLRLQPGNPDFLNNWGNALSEYAGTKTGSEADRLFAEANQKYSESLRLQPNNPAYLNNWGNAFLAQAKTKTGSEADQLFAEACQKFSESLRFKPDDADFLNNWGNAFSAQAKTKTGSEADGLFAEACQKFSESLRLKPDNPDFLNKWGVALAAHAKTKSGSEADQLFAEARQKYNESLRLKPDNPDVLRNWGAALTVQARTKQDPEADRLFAEADQKYRESLLFKLDNPDVLNNWGISLADQAKTKKGPEADRLFAEAGQKYSESLRLKPDNTGYFDNWGAALINQAATKTGQEASHLLEQARSKLIEAERILPGSGSFNLACIEAILGNAPGSLEYLRRASKLSKKRIDEESDFDPIRSDSAFREFVESLPKE